MRLLPSDRNKAQNPQSIKVAEVNAPQVPSRLEDKLGRALKSRSLVLWACVVHPSNS